MAAEDHTPVKSRLEQTIEAEPSIRGRRMLDGFLRKYPNNLNPAPMTSRGDLPVCYLRRFSFRVASLFASLLLSAGTACADCGGTIDQAVCTSVRLTSVYMDANYDAYATVDGNTSALPCTASSGLLKLPRLFDNFKETYATLLAAHLSDRVVTIRLGSTSPCTIVYVVVF